MISKKTMKYYQNWKKGIELRTWRWEPWKGLNLKVDCSEKLQCCSLLETLAKLRFCKLEQEMEGEFREGSARASIIMLCTSGSDRECPKALSNAHIHQTHEEYDIRNLDKFLFGSRLFSWVSLVLPEPETS